MTTQRRLSLIVLCSLALSSAASHALLRLSRIQIYDAHPAPEAQPSPSPNAGTDGQSAPIVAAGSSLTAYGFDWDMAASQLARPIKVLTRPAASPSELEVMQEKVPATDFTVICISISDMDEYRFSDGRAEIVPPMRSWRDLRESKAEELLQQRMRDEYAMRYLRILFPTAGRSMGLLVGFRTVVGNLIHRHGSSTAEALPVFDASPTANTNRLSDWGATRIFRNAQISRDLTGGFHSFAGPKHLALERMLRLATARGKAVLLIIPVSPLYSQEVFTPPVTQAFEASLSEVAARFRVVKWIRLDRVAALHSNELYFDFEHLNSYGRAIATPAMVEQLGAILHSP